MKKLMIATLIASMSFGLTACTEDEIASSALLIGVAVVGAGVVASGATCHGGYVEKCTDAFTRRGDHHRFCRQEYDSCARIYRDSGNSPLALSSTAKKVKPSLSLQAANVASKYHMSFEAAETVISTIEAAKKADLSQIESVGLTQKDLATLSRGWKLSSSSINNMSLALDLDLKQTHKMVSAIEAQFKNVLEKQHDDMVNTL